MFGCVAVCQKRGQTPCHWTDKWLLWNFTQVNCACRQGYGQNGHSGSLLPLISRSCILSVLSYPYSNKKLDILVDPLYPNAENFSYYTTQQSFTLSVDTLKFIGKSIYRIRQFQSNYRTWPKYKSSACSYTANLFLKEKENPNSSQRTNIWQKTFLR